MVVPSASELGKRMGASPPGPVTWLVPEPETRQSRETPGSLQIAGSMLVLNGYASTTRTSDHLRFVATALVDFTAVQAEWTVYGPDRERVEEVARGTGLARIRSTPVAFTVRIPVPPGAHEVETYVELAPLESRDTSDADVRRFIVSRQAGARTPSAPCTVATPGELLEPEARLRASGLSQSLAFRDGEKVHVALENGGAGTYVVVPLLDGRLLAGPEIFRVEAGEGTVAARRSWTLDVEPTVGFVAAVWKDPFRTDKGAQWTSNFTSSNFIPAHSR